MAKPYLDIIALSAKVESARSAAGLTYADLGGLAQVDPAQAYRICKGRFRTISWNVLRICNALAIDIPAESRPDVSVLDENYAEILKEAVVSAWDGTPNGARRLQRVLEALSG